MRGLLQPERLDPGGLSSDAGTRTFCVGFALSPSLAPPPAARHHLVLVDGGDGAGGPVAQLTSFLQEGVQFVPEVRVGQLRLLQVDVGEAERRGGA